MHGEVTRSVKVRATTLVAVAIAMLVGCGGQQAEHAPVALFGSGSRLVASYWETSGGVRVFSSWYDTKLETSCAFRNAEDGVLRCTPSGLNAATPSDEATFITGECGLEPAPPPWVSVGACAGGLIGVGGVQDCAAASSFSVGPCAASCAPATMSSGMLSCIRADLVTTDGSVFADASCTDEVAQTCSDAPPSLGERMVPDEATCSYTSEFFTVGAEVAVSEVFTASSSACISFVSAPTGHFYEVGAPVVQDPAVDVVVRAVGSGRVQPEFFTLPDGALLERSPALAIHDTQRGSECSLPFGVSHDGTVQCVPEPSGEVVPAATAGCPELVAAPPSGCPASPSRPVIGVRAPTATDACARLKMPFEYVEVGAEITPSAECTPAGLNGPFYAVGARIDAASFATVTYAKDKPR